MGVYTLSPFFGPVLGPLISGFICQVCVVTFIVVSSNDSRSPHIEHRLALGVSGLLDLRICVFCVASASTSVLRSQINSVN